MTSPILLPAGDSTPGRLQVVELNLTNPVNSLAPNWTPLQYVESADLNPDDAVMVDATTFGDGGYSGQDKLGAAWSAAVVINHMSVPGANPPAYDPTHNYLETKGVGVFGAANRVQLRFYDYDVNDSSGVITPRGQAYMGFANYAWPRFGSVGQADARKVSLTFMGKGKLVPIAHPYPAVAVVPTITRIDPQSNFNVAGGQAFDLYGSGFTTVPAATGVKFGGTNATNFTVVSDSKIIGVYPAKTAGVVPVVVTNTVGASQPFNVTYA